jgi:hypothetical protein
MNLFRRIFIKCFYCKTKVLKSKAFVVQYNALDGAGKLHLCENCAKDLEQISTNLKELYNE